MTRKTWMTSATVAGLALIVAHTAFADTKPDTSKLEAGPISISAAAITSFQRTGGSETRFGKLNFRGGLVLTAPGEPNFGGWSGFVLDDDGKSFIAVSDSGVWLKGAIRYQSAAPMAIDNARMGPLLASDGRPLKRARDRDAEAMALVSGIAGQGQLQIAFEQNARIARYEVTAGGLSASRGLLEKPAKARAMRRNGGFEAMTVMKGGPFAGSTVAIAERLYDQNRNHTGWIWTNGTIKSFALTNIGDFDITDIASLNDGSLFVLERRFRWLEGVKMRIRRLSVAELGPGKTAEGDILIEANLENEIDNMEGLAVTRAANGEILLTAISDDNFNRYLQRTVLLQFALADTQTVKAPQ